MKTLMLLAVYFLATTSMLALVLFPDVRAIALSGWRRGTLRLAQMLRGWQAVSQQGFTQANEGGRSGLSRLGRWARGHAALLSAILALLVLAPLVALGWRSWFSIDTFDHTVWPAQDERIAVLLGGEHLVPPEPLPPAMFATREVELVRPTVQFASRDWSLLDPIFAQRLLQVYRIMREQHGYDLVLLEGYRSPQRQAKLAAMGGSITKAGAFLSYHQFGLAADTAFLRDGKLLISEKDPWAMRGYVLYGQVATSLGLTWGGGWKSIEDYGHVELRRPGVLGNVGHVTPKTGYGF